MATFPHVTQTKASKAAAPIGGFVSPTPRIASIRAELFSTPYSICLERSRLLGEFHRSRQGRQSARTEHPLVQRALALNYIFSHRKPRIYDGELIIGNMTSKRIAANYYIEGGSINILEDVFRLGKRTIPLKLSGRETCGTPSHRAQKRIQERRSKSAPQARASFLFSGFFPGQAPLHHRGGGRGTSGGKLPDGRP